MTCIVGFEVSDGVVMGGDSAAVDGYNIQKTRLRKVFSLGSFLIGYTTSFRMGQLLEFNLEFEKLIEGKSGVEFMVTSFIPSVRKCLSEGGFTKIENSVEESGQFLVGFRGILYMIDSDFQVNSYEDGFAAIGSGAKYALGSLYSSSYSDLSPEERVEEALKAASHFSVGVTAPFYIEKLHNESGKNQ